MLLRKLVLGCYKCGALTSKPYAFRGRSWELRSSYGHDITDSMCSSIRMDFRGIEVMRILPVLNNMINEEWISDRIRFLYDGFKLQRLFQPMIRIFRFRYRRYKKQLMSRLIAVSWQRMIYFVRKIIFFFLAVSKERWFYHKKEGFSSVTIQSLNKLSFISSISNSVDLESIMFYSNFYRSLGYSSFYLENQNYNLLNDYRSNYILNYKLDSLEKSDLIISFGSNIRLESPLLAIRIRRNKNLRNFYYFGSHSSFAFMSTGVAANVLSLLFFLKGRHWLSSLLIKSRVPIFLIGHSFLNRKEGTNLLNFVLAYKHQFFKKIGISYMFPGSNNIGVQESSLIKNKYILLDKWRKNSARQDFLLYYSVDGGSLLDLKRKCCKIYQGSHGDISFDYSDLVLPVTNPYEKNSYYINLLGLNCSFSKMIKKKTNAVVSDKILLNVLSCFFGIDLLTCLMRSLFFFNEVGCFSLLHYGELKSFSLMAVNRSLLSERQLNSEMGVQKGGQSRHLKFFFNLLLFTSIVDHLNTSEYGNRIILESLIKIDLTAIGKAVANFYLSNSLSRASRILCLAHNRMKLYGKYF